jgi:hypothetical protein
MKIGTPVSATMSGRVVQVDLNADYGKSILIENPDNGYQTLYAHLSEEAVKVGDMITAGQVIGKSGDTGNANGPHLHYEVRSGKNNPVNPASISSGGMLSAALGSGSTMSLLAASTPLPGIASNSTDMSGGSSGAAAGPVNKANTKALYNYLISKGLSASGATGVIGNLVAESGLNTNALGDKGTSYGLAQWHLGRWENLKKYAAKNKLDASSLTAQEGFLMQELSAYPSLLKTLKNSKTSELDAANAFMVQFERPAKPTATAAAYRATSGKIAVQAIGGGTSGYGGAGLGTHTAGSVVNNFNIPITLQNGNDAELVRVANKIKSLIDNTTTISAMGDS